jgi:hypothetical protein
MAREAIELRDHKRSVVNPARSQRGGELWAVVPAPALDLHVLRDQLRPITVQEGENRTPLCLDAEAIRTLALRRYSEVRDEPTGHRHPHSHPVRVADRPFGNMRRKRCARR